MSDKFVIILVARIVIMTSATLKSQSVIDIVLQICFIFNANR